MSYLKFAFCALALSAASASAETNFVTIGKSLAHPTRIVARFNDNTVSKNSAALHSAGVKVVREYSLIPGLVTLDVDDRVAQSGQQKLTLEEQGELLKNRIISLQESGSFSYVEPSYVVKAHAVPTDSRFDDGTLWGLRNTGADGGISGVDIGAVAAWDITTGSTNVIVAVIDSGIRYTHQDLAANMWVNPGEIAGNGIDDDRDGYTDNVYGINAINNSGNPFDDNDHGTHVAGTIGAVANDGNPHVGVAWRVRLMGCKFLGADGFGFTDDAIQCINFALSKGARILNNSWGGGPFSQGLFDSVNAARNAGVLFVASAGNEANNNDAAPSYPGSFQLDNVITVAALDRRDNVADFSNYGRTSVHLGAPGVDIFSSTSGTDSEYQSFNGTSMAAPHVSGAAALILANSPDALLAEIRERIISQTVPVPALRDITRTGGRLNVLRALEANADGRLEISVNPPAGVELLAGSTVPIAVTVTDLFGVTNAVVKGTITGSTNELEFVDSGAQPDAARGDAAYTADVTLPTGTNAATLSLTVTAPDKTNATLNVVYTIVPGPPNDNFANAIKIPAAGAILQATNRFGTTEPREPRHAGVPSAAASLWWTWSSPTAQSTVIVDTTGSAIDTVIGVYTNNTLQTLREVASVDDVGPNNSVEQGYLILSNTIPGVTYHIAIAGYSSEDTGVIRLRVRPGGRPDHDAPSVVITGPIAGSIYTDASNPRVAIRGTAADPQPDASGIREVLVKVNDGLAVTALGTTSWVSTNRLDEGINTITVIAADFAGNISSAQKINVTYKPLKVPNDVFNRAIELTGDSGIGIANTEEATKELGEPFHGGNEGGRSVWWWFRPATDGVLTLSTEDSEFDTLLGVYTGNRVSTLTEVSSNDDESEFVRTSKVEQAVRAGQAYMIAVDGFGGAGGETVLNYTFVPSALRFVTVESTAGGAVSPGSGYYREGATVIFTAEANPFFQFSRWEGSSNASTNPLSITVSGDMQLFAVFEPFPYDDDFESGNFGRRDWSSAGQASWQVQSQVVNGGRYAARSGNIGHGQSSSLILRETTFAGLASFDFKVSSEEGWDWLEFLVDGRRIERWSGERGWLTFTFPLTEGAHTLEWRYRKDAVSGSSGSDAAFIDNLTLPKESTGGPIQGSPVQLSVNTLEDGRVQVVVNGEEDQQYVIQSSTDLQNWSSLSKIQTTGGSASFVDSPASGPEARFYRVIAP